jgi:signal transduction histidine kinase
MIPRSLRARSVAAASLAILLGLVVMSIGADLLIGRHLHSSLDRALRARAVEVAQLSASAPALLTTPGSLDSPLGGTQVSTEVVDRQGRIVARSLGLGGRVLPVAEVLGEVVRQGRGRYADTNIGDQSLRVFVAPLSEFSGPAAGGAVAVAASTRDLDTTLEQVRLFVIVAALVAAAVAALALALLMRRALAPLGRLTSAAAEIERTGDVRRRLPEPASGDEVGRLAGTLNGMLDALERARESERRFLADASHELRTPLTALVGNVSFLSRYGATPELVAELEHDTRRIAKLADDLLVLSREEAAAAPDDIVRLDEMARDAGADELCLEPVSVLGDRPALRRALDNLVENARRHGSGCVTVATASHDGVALLTVSDEGPGIVADEAFERFWRGGTSVPGSGLGLAIVRATAERHGGRAYAKGARVNIELPALRELSESPATTEVSLTKGRP